MLHPSDASSETTPALDLSASFLVGRDAEGHWLAVETHGLGGGLFRDRQSALHYAAAETDRRPGAVRVCEETLVLALLGRAEPAFLPPAHDLALGLAGAR